MQTLAAAFLLHYFLTVPGAVVAAPQRPHILFIVADDLGFNDLGYQQSSATLVNPHGFPTTSPAAGVMKSPNLDQLALESTKLGSYYVQPLCSPTRSTIMTGRYPQHTGIGPDVIVAPNPYGLPAREKLLPEYLAGSYACHAIGKWHLGTCDERYLPTFRGFESYLGYTAGGQGYYQCSSDRRADQACTLPSCIGDSSTLSGGLVNCSTGSGPKEYSDDVFVARVRELLTQYRHQQESGTDNDNDHDSANDKGDDRSLFLYLALQSVHNPYDVPPLDVVDINTTFAEIEDYTRRIYAGMVFTMDVAVGQIVALFKEAKLWDDTVLIFTTDNGGIGPGSNFPLRGSKVHLWEGGIRGIGFVRGTNSALRPVPGNRTTGPHQLIHSTDWLPTIVQGVANLTLPQKQTKQTTTTTNNNNNNTHPSPPNSVAHGGSLSSCAAAGDRNGWEVEGLLPLALDGVNQWGVISGVQHTSARDTIFHNVAPVNKVRPVNVGNATHPVWSTSSCLSSVDNRTGPCHGFGLTGSAVRVGDWKLVVTASEQPGGAPWEDSAPAGTPQYTPGGHFPQNHTPVFNATLYGWGSLTVPEAFNRSLYLFNITADPTETHNLANSTHPDVVKAFHDILQRYEAFLEANDTVGSLSWRYGFTDPTWTKTIGGHCGGPFSDSHYCSYGHEFDCFVYGESVQGASVKQLLNVTDANACQAACAVQEQDSGHACVVWVWSNASHTCDLKDNAQGSTTECADCIWGPAACSEL